jgi:hypothetical protein
LTASGRGYFPQKFPEDNWSLHITYRENLSNFSDLATAIRTDDVDSLQSLCVEQSIPFDAIVPFCLYAVDDQQFTYTKLISYACLCGSVRCFRFLLMNLPKSDDSPIGHVEMEAAVSGGCHEMVRILEDAGVSFEDWDANLAIEGLHFELFEWLIVERHLKFSWPKQFVPVRVFLFALGSEFEWGEQERPAVVREWAATELEWLGLKIADDAESS